MTVKHRRRALFAFLPQAALLVGFWSVANAFDSKELPYESAGTPTTVSISTSTWTKVPAADAVLKNRAGILVNVPATNTAAIVGVFNPRGATLSATTIRPIEMAKGTNRFFEAGPNMELYFLSLHTSTEAVHVQELAK